jgi:hypothetical protein
MRRVLGLALLAALARGEDPPTPDAIQRAIDAGVRWLKSAQKDGGNWGPCFPDRAYDGGRASAAYSLGPTTFALFTLATCGVPKTDPVVQRGLQWFIQAEQGDVRYASYESSATILMLCALNRVAPRKLVRGETRRPPEGSGFSSPEWIRLDERVQHLIGEGSCYARGGFGYWRSEKYADVSATQFAILALRAASFAGYPVEKVRPDVWSGTAAFLIQLQASSGGFPYHAPYPPSPGMTAAALASLLVCREQMALLKQKEPAGLEGAIEKGFAYLDANFDVASNPSPHVEGAEGQSYYHYCYLYAIERTGMISGRRELGGKGWYARGAAFLVREQGNMGRWSDDTCMRPEDVLGTCFALLFLKKATIPAVTPSR